MKLIEYLQHAFKPMSWNNIIPDYFINSFLREKGLYLSDHNIKYFPVKLGYEMLFMVQQKFE